MPGLMASSWSVGDTIGLIGVVAAAVIPTTTAVIAGLWKLSSQNARMIALLEDHGRRLDVLETAQLEGPAAGRRKRRKLEHDHPTSDLGPNARMAEADLATKDTVRGLSIADPPGGDLGERHGRPTGAGHVPA
jgi:hypothetical protein